LIVDFVPEILDKRTVFVTQNGGRAEWRLLSSWDSVNNIPGPDFWKPLYVNAEGQVEFEPAWLPLPGSQNTFLECPVFEALYEGTRGPGKTITLLMDFAKEVGKGYGKAWRGILFRRTFGDLDDVVRKIEEFFPKIFPGFRFLKSKSEYAAVWPSGEQLLLRHLIDENDYESYHGHEYPWIGFEELTQWENDKAYKLMFSCCRPTAPGIPCRIRATTNPYGVGHSWVKKRFRLPGWRSRVITVDQEVPRVAIHGNLAENFLLLHTAPNYPSQILQAAKNPAQAEAWLKGSWDVNAGGMFDDLWSDSIHIIPDFPAKAIPRSWKITRAYDHGQSHPFAVGWWLESSGDPLKWEGQEYGRIRGDLILFDEWYGTTGNDQEGVRMQASKIASGIIDREKDMGLSGRVQPGPADTEIWSKDSRGTGRAPIDDMMDEGIYWERADKTPGSRKRGWEMIRARLTQATPSKDGTREKPGLFICRRCKYWLNYVPPTPRDPADPDDVPAKYEDHLCDMTRYRLNWEIPWMRRSSF
jgi:Terminase large subunit, T4likevirus-type, N-terminal